MCSRIPGKTEKLSHSFCISVNCLSLIVFLSFFCSSVWPSVRPSFFLLFVHLSFFCLSVFLFSFFLFPVSNFSFQWKVHQFSSSRNSRRERELFIVPESRCRELFGNCFHENFGNWRDMTEKLWCLLRMLDNKYTKQ